MRKKHQAIMILCITLCFLLGGCAAPVASELVTDSAKYLQTNSYVKEELAAFSVFPLPEAIPDDATVLEYRYAYDCAAFGDPNFSVILVLQYTSETAYQQEQQRIRSCMYSDTSEKAGESEYYFGNTLSGFEVLTDDKVEDGNCAVLQFVFLNDEELTVTYAIGQLYDGSRYDDEIVRMLGSKL